MTSPSIPRLRPPSPVRGVTREGSAARPGDGPGVRAAAVDCSKLRGLARSLCYKAHSAPTLPF
ncbi:hypothetical protein [Cryptosporangium minutisporangium]|uniref:Uncharacterized protein n=1 Tax=Cryptosporangium minutisporangium TaxID=113569 RepID=A0ABP6SRU5_9ACTN